MRKPGSAVIASCAAAFALLAGCGGGGGGGISSVPSGNAPSTATPASIAVAFASAPNAIAGFAESFALTVTVKDANGTPLQGTYRVPITLSDSDTSGATKLSVPTVASSSQAVSLQYSGARISGSVTISASAPGVPTENVTPATLSVDGTHSYVGGERYAYTRATISRRYNTAGQIMSTSREDDNVTVTVQPSPAAFNGHGGLTDVTTSATSSDGQTQDTTDDYYTYVAGPPVELETYGSTDTETITTPGYPVITLTDVLNLDAPSVVDELPQEQNAHWNPAQGSVELMTIDDPVDGDNGQQKWVTAADGSYETASKDKLYNGLTYSQFTVNSDASYTYLAASSDSGLLSTDLGTGTAPSGGTVAYHSECRMEIDLPAQPLLPVSVSEFPTPAPNATPGNMQVCNNDQNTTSDTTAESWYPADYIPLDQESTSVVEVNGGVPADCNVSSIATLADHLQYQRQWVDPVMGLTEHVSDDYYAPNIGLVCSLQSISYQYHDMTSGAAGVRVATTVTYSMTQGATGQSVPRRSAQSRAVGAMVGAVLHRGLRVRLGCARPLRRCSG